MFGFLGLAIVPDLEPLNRSPTSVSLTTACYKFSAALFARLDVQPLQKKTTKGDFAICVDSHKKSSF